MIFSQPDYIKVNEIPNVYWYSWQGKNHLSATASFSIQGNKAVSLPNAPYSGIQLSAEVNDASNMPADLISNLSENQGEIEQIIIKQAPQIFYPNYDVLKTALLESGYDITQEINHHIVLDNWKSKWNPMELRRVRKCQRLNLCFIKEPADSIDEIYDFLVKCRAQQGLGINIDLIRLRKLLKAFPNDYLIRSVRGSDQALHACLVAIKVNHRIVYSFLPAFDRQYAEHSPLVFLFHEFLNELTELNFQILDLGISSIDGKPQKGLISFKEHMGGIFSYRDTFILNI